jgi:hypothetical protein
MTESDVQGILTYVRAGGTFVAQHHTARHLPRKPDAWPLARALGLTVKPKWMSDENFHRWALAKMRFDPKQSLLPSLRGKTVQGSGVAIDYLGNEHSGAVSYAGRAGDDRIRAVAKWEEDGSMAIAEARLGRGRLLLLGTPFYTRMRDVSGVWVNEQRRSAWLDEFLTALGVPRDSWTGAHEMWAEIWRSKNGLFDLYPVTRMDSKGEGTLAAEIRIRRATPVREITEISALEHPARKVRWKDGVMTLPRTPYEPMETRVFVAPRADIARSALDWFRAQSRIWRALPPVPDVRRPRPVAVPPDLLSLADGWTLKVKGRPDRTVPLGAFGTLGLPENTFATFEKTVAVPEAWKGSRVDLVFDAQHWFWGILPKGRLFVNGKEAPLRRPIRPEAQPPFSVDVTEAAAGGSLTIRLDVDGASASMMRRDKSGLSKPHGVTGIFYLRAVPPAVKRESVPGKWWAASAYNRLREVEPGQKVKCTYLETRFALPRTWPTRRLFIESSVPLGFLCINGEVLIAPGWMRRLDVSGLVRSDGGENVIRWVPASRHVASWQGTWRGRVPPLELVWTGKKAP